MMLLTFIEIVFVDLKLYFRDWAAAFWTLLFPFLLLILLMAAFGGDRHSAAVSLDIRDQDGSPQSTAYAESLEQILGRIESVRFKVSVNGTPNGSAIVLTIPNGFGERVSAHQSATVAASIRGARSPLVDIAASILSSVNDRLNITAGRSPELVRLSFAQQSKHGAELPYGPYLVAGIAAMVMFSTCLFGFTVPLVGFQRSGYLKILEVLPLPKSMFLAGFVLGRILVLTVYVAFFFLFAYIAFGIVIGRGAASLAGFSVLAIFAAGAFLSIGLLIAAIAPTRSAASALCSLVYFCLMFISDLFISTKNFPAFVNAISSAFPLQPLVRAFRAQLFEGVPLTQQTGALVIASVWMLLCLSASTVILRYRSQ